MPLQATSGAASYDAFGGGVPVVPAYIEEVFSTFLYTGNDSTQTITNNIDLSTKGGMVWTKSRNGGYDHQLVDTARGTTKIIASNLTDAQTTDATSLTAFNTTGYTLGLYDRFNATTYNYVSWTFRKQPKFFDIVTYTGNGVARTISHNLGSVPACIMVKRLTGSANNWAVYHRSLGNATNISLSLSTAATSNPYNWNSTTPTATEFSLGAENIVNDNGSTFVAYIFAHDAGGFGLTGTDNVISCGSYSGTGALNTITLGYEPQWIMVKNTSAASNWVIIDNMRGFPVYATIGGATLFPNSTDEENSGGSERFGPTATGFQVWGNATLNNASGNTYIYIAIRRGPMKVPTSGASVFDPITDAAGLNSIQNYDSFLWRPYQNATTAPSYYWVDKLRGYPAANVPYLNTSTTAAEASRTAAPYMYKSSATSTSFVLDPTGPSVLYRMKRAPSFMDVVCYIGTGAAGRTVTHNLGVAPQLVITKGRDTTTTYGDWMVLPPTLQNVKLNEDTSQDDSSTTAYYFGNGTSVVAPTSTVFTLGSENTVNQSGKNFVAYLFATCAGVSKVGSYTGTATTKQIDCGFTSGARFVLIKRVDGVGAWYVWDTARGIVSGNDPYLLLNTTAAEVTSTDYIDTYSAGFEISSTAPAAINASGGTFIFLAIA